MGLAKLNGAPVAAQMWTVAHGRAAIYKVAYHEAYKQYAAGTLVTALLMEQVIDVDRVTEIDYLIGDDAYKKPGWRTGASAGASWPTIRGRCAAWPAWRARSRAGPSSHC